MEAIGSRYKQYVVLGRKESNGEESDWMLGYNTMILMEEVSAWGEIILKNETNCFKHLSDIAI